MPAILVRSLAVGLALYVVAAVAVSAPNPAVDAARLDVIPSWLWGRAEAVRTSLRMLAIAAAPLLFGFLSDELGGGATRTSTSGAGAYAGSGPGLQRTFLLMLIPHGRRAASCCCAPDARTPTKWPAPWPPNARSPLCE